MFKRIIVLLIAILLTGTAAWPQATTPRPAAPAFDANAFLAPFLDDQTIAVAHVDAAKIDTAALQTYVKSLAGDLHLPTDANFDKQLADARTTTDNFLNRFKQAGGRHLFAVFNQPDIYPRLQPFAFLIKIEPGGSAKDMAKLIADTFPVSQITPDELKMELTAPDQAPPLKPAEELKIAVLRDDVVFLGQRAPLRRLAAPQLARKSNLRPDLAFQSADGALEAVISPTADDRRALKELMPTLPQEIGGASTDFLTREPLALRLELTLPPKTLIRLSFSRIRTAAAPDDLNAVLLNLRDRLLVHPLFTQLLDMPQLKPQAADLTATIKQILTPKPGPALTLDDNQIRSLLRIVMPTVDDARRRALRSESAVNIRSVVQACIVYASDNKNAFPTSFDQLVQLGQIPPQALINPTDDKHRRYVYNRPALPLNKLPSWDNYPLVWEEVDEANAPRYVGFTDGHVELVANRAALDALLKAANTATTTPQAGSGLP